MSSKVAGAEEQGEFDHLVEGSTTPVWTPTVDGEC